MKYSLIATWNMSLEGMKKAKTVLENDGSLSEAILSGINIVENEPSFHSVGYGGLPDKEGTVTCDAAFMDGDQLRFGALGCVRNIRNLVNVAEKLSHEERNNFLVGEGALQYAKEQGFSEEEMLTKEAKEIYEQELVKESHLHPYHDTVCFIGMKEGHMIVATSTSGLFMKHPGRIGDSPVCGAGFYADSNAGACAATGMGEDVARSLLSFRCVSLIKDGKDVQEAVDQTLKEFEERVGKAREISLIAMDKNGKSAYATNTDFAYTTANEEQEACAYCVRLSKEDKPID